ncbi:hypothetical protein SAMN04487910_3072 [Aquimarina amphilecti]|uniref:Uncharacterized protein n=1 Tax=Aquimarina amphilecti TaxID=1038014 RepID=A0A1H7SA67_AQUAM|nr:hypothetical protein [Aquimarina amphilecti]SEL69522.1 hypothetical protein SAMN04487910_3072 [Aquimarina amphilecti]
MLKKISNLEGVQKLNKHQQRRIKGGITSCSSDSECVSAGGPGCIAACYPVGCIFDLNTCFILGGGGLG